MYAMALFYPVLLSLQAPLFVSAFSIQNRAVRSSRYMLDQTSLLSSTMHMVGNEKSSNEGTSTAPSTLSPIETNILDKELLKFRRNRRNGAQLAHHRLDSALKERDPNVTEKSFNTVFLAYASQSGRGDWMAPLSAEHLLQKMKRHPSVRPSVFSYNAVMEAWVKSATQGKNRPGKAVTSSKPNLAQQQRQNQPGKQRSIVQAKNFVLRLFDEMTKQQGARLPLKPDTYTYNLILELYAKSPNPTDLRKAEEWFLNMECEPDRQTINLMFSAHANHGKAEQAERLLLGLIQDYREKLQQQNNDESCEAQDRIPNQVWFHCVLKAYSKDQMMKSATIKTAELGDQVDNLLEAMHRLYKEDNVVSVKPDASTYNHVINIHAEVGNIRRVEELLWELEDIFAASGDDLKMSPDRITYTTALKAYANGVGSHDEVQAADDLFQRMLDLAGENGRPNMSPNIFTYNTMLKIYAKTGNHEYLQKATTLLEQMQQQSFVRGSPRPPPPNAQSFTTILHGWSRTKNVREAGYKAEELLNLLESLPPSARRKLHWTTVYNSVITAWSKSGHKAAPQRVESLLNLLEDKSYDSGGVVAPDRTTFLCIADTYAKFRIKDAEQRCEDLLFRMKQLEEAGVVSSDLRSSRALYNSILNALAKSGHPSSKDKAEEILNMMESSPAASLRPDIVTYSTVLDCHTKSGSNNTADRAEELLRFVEGSYRNGNSLLKPNAVFYSAILQAWAKTATIEGAEKAEWLLRRNEGLYERGAGYEYCKPHAILFNAVMDSIARSGLPDAGERAEELLQEMKTLYEAGDEEMKPTRRSFNAVMLAYRQGGQGAEKAEKLLRSMEELAENSNFVGPNVVSYNCAIQAIVDDNGITTPEKSELAANRAQALLDYMEDKSIRPDATTYSCVIEAWLKCNNEKGSVMAELMLKKFLDLVESTKDQEAKLDAEVVWDVINAYKKSE